MNDKFLKTSLGRFRLIGILEGISYLALLGIAMPLKYFADMPTAVKYPGWVHGLLFVLYIYMLIQVAIEHRWSFKKFFLGGLASILPFGPFVLDAMLLKQMQAKAEEAK
jgi:integral membrane protein